MCQNPGMHSFPLEVSFVLRGDWPTCKDLMCPFLTHYFNPKLSSNVFLFMHIFIIFSFLLLIHFSYITYITSWPVSSPSTPPSPQPPTPLISPRSIPLPFPFKIKEQASQVYHPNTAYHVAIRLDTNFYIKAGRSKPEGGEESEKQAKGSKTSPTPTLRSPTRTFSYTAINIYAENLA